MKKSEEKRIVGKTNENKIAPQEPNNEIWMTKEFIHEVTTRDIRKE